MNQVVRSLKSGTGLLVPCRTRSAHPQTRGVLTAAPDLLVPGGRRPEARRTASGRPGMKVFDREMKRRQRGWAAVQQDSQQYDYLRDEVRPKAYNNKITCKI